jgi:hypothetical protein
VGLKRWVLIAPVIGGAFLSLPKAIEVDARLLADFPLSPAIRVQTAKQKLTSNRTLELMA